MIRIAIVLALLSTTARADVSDAERLYQEGQTAYDAKRYDDAIKLWEQSYAASRLPALVFNIAQAHRLAGHCTKAVEAYRRFLTLDPDSGERPTAEQMLRELEPCKKAAPIDVNQPKVEHLPSGVSYRLEDHGGGKRRTGVIVGGAGIALFATGIYFGTRATSLANEVKDACATGCEWATVEDKDASGRRAQTLQYVFLGAGGAAIVAGASLYLLGAKARETRVLVQPNAGGGTVGVTGRF